MPRYYEIKSKPYIFHAIITLNEVIKIRFGGRTDCIDISIYTTEEDKDYPNIDAIGYDKNCVIDESNAGLLPGTGTVIMVKTALQFVKMLYPNIKHFLFKDLSNIYCHGGTNFPLSTLYIAKYGRTWYQTHFDAEPTLKKDKIEIQRVHHYLNKNIKLEYDTFYSTFIKPHLRYMKKIKTNQIYEVFKESYDENKTYLNFFYQLAEHGDCVMLQEWLPAFIASICSVRFPFVEWKMKEDLAFQKISYNEIKERPFVTRRNNDVKRGGSFPLGKK